MMLRPKIGSVQGLSEVVQNVSTGAPVKSGRSFWGQLGDSATAGKAAALRHCSPTPSNPTFNGLRSSRSSFGVTNPIGYSNISEPTSLPAQDSFQHTSTSTPSPLPSDMASQLNSPSVQSLNLKSEFLPLEFVDLMVSGLGVQNQPELTLGLWSEFRTLPRTKKLQLPAPFYHLLLSRLLQLPVSRRFALSFQLLSLVHINGNEEGTVFRGEDLLKVFESGLEYGESEEGSADLSVTICLRELLGMAVKLPATDPHHPHSQTQNWNFSLLERWINLNNPFAKSKGRVGQENALDWFLRRAGGGSRQNTNKFKKDLRDILPNNTEWRNNILMANRRLERRLEVQSSIPPQLKESVSFIPEASAIQIQNTILTSLHYHSTYTQETLQCRLRQCFTLIDNLASQSEDVPIAGFSRIITALIQHEALQQATSPPTTSTQHDDSVLDDLDEEEGPTALQTTEICLFFQTLVKTDPDLSFLSLEEHRNLIRIITGRGYTKWSSFLYDLYRNRNGHRILPLSASEYSKLFSLIWEENQSAVEGKLLARVQADMMAQGSALSEDNLCKLIELWGRAPGNLYAGEITRSLFHSLRYGQAMTEKIAIALVGASFLKPVGAVFEVKELIEGIYAAASSQPTLRTYQLILSAFYNTKTEEGRNGIFETVRYLKENGPSPTVDMYDFALASVLPNSVEFQSYLPKAASIFREIIQSGLNPSQTTLNLFFRTLVQQSQIDLAIEAFHHIHSSNYLAHGQAVHKVIEFLRLNDRLPEAIDIGSKWLSSFTKFESDCKINTSSITVNTPYQTSSPALDLREHHWSALVARSTEEALNKVLVMEMKKMKAEESRLEELEANRREAVQRQRLLEGKFNIRRENIPASLERAMSWSVNYMRR